jgi:lipopolysaccharide transport system ATP-binding protein
MRVAFGGEVHGLPPGSVVGLVGEHGSGVGDLLKAAGGRFIGPGHTWDMTSAPVLAIGYALDLRDAFQRERAQLDLDTLRKAGSTVLLASHDVELLRRLADEVWWIHGARVAGKGDPDAVLRQYAMHIAERLRAASAGKNEPISAAQRRGDGRASLESIETLDDSGTLVSAWTSGEPAAIRVRVRFAADIEDPVVGIMIRTRIGMEVYGTNTQLEGLKFGPCSSGDVRTIEFRFACNLCPQQYTITAASHDPDGVWHDWMEDALACTVVDSRYTAGVANLRASVRVVG